MALALAASPAYVLRFRILGLPSTALEVLLLLAILAGLVALGRRLPMRTPYTWPALALLGAVTLELFFSPDLRAAAGIWKAYFVEPVLAGAVIAGLASSRGRARVLLAGLAVAGTIVSLTNLAVVLPALVGGSFNLVTPPVAIYNSANAVPLYLIPLDAVALALLVYGGHRLEQSLAAAFLLLSGLAVLLSFSRAGWATLAVVVAFVAAFHPWRWRVWGALAALLVLSLGVPPVRHRIAVEFEPDNPNNTVSRRIWLWRSTLSMLARRPLFGGGLSGFKTSVEPYRDPRYTEDLIYPHNLALNLWSETGLLGLFAFAWLLVAGFRASLRALRGDPWVRAFGIGVLAVLVAIVVHGLADVPYFKNDQALAFWALLGIQAGTLRFSLHNRG
jgi:O-antigen ligase